MEDWPYWDENLSNSLWVIETCSRIDGGEVYNKKLSKYALGAENVNFCNFFKLQILSKVLAIVLFCNAGLLRYCQ